MPHDLSLYAFELPDTTEWLSGDNRTLAFTVTDDQENPVDISNATVTWSLHERPYESDASTAVLSGQDSDVEVVTDSRVDTSQGEFEVRIESSATEDLWGEYHQRPEVTQPDGSTASWRGDVILTA